MLVARAELLDEAAESEASVAAVYGEAMSAYGRACMLSSSEEGDDLPGLLNNWGVGLHSLGTHAKVAIRPSQSVAEHPEYLQLHPQKEMHFLCYRGNSMQSLGDASHTQMPWASAGLTPAYRHWPLTASAHDLCYIQAMTAAMGTVDEMLSLCFCSDGLQKESIHDKAHRMYCVCRIHTWRVLPWRKLHSDCGKPSPSLAEILSLTMPLETPSWPELTWQATHQRH